MQPLIPRDGAFSWIYTLISNGFLSFLKMPISANAIDIIATFGLYRSLYRPCHFGGRFSVKALGPSRASSEFRTRWPHAALRRYDSSKP